MLELQLTTEIETMLDEQASRAAQTKEEFVRRAILDRLEDLEDSEMGHRGFAQFSG